MSACVFSKSKSQFWKKEPHVLVQPQLIWVATNKRNQIATMSKFILNTIIKTIKRNRESSFYSWLCSICLPRFYFEFHFFSSNFECHAVFLSLLFLWTEIKLNISIYVNAINELVNIKCIYWITNQRACKPMHDSTSEYVREIL